MKFDISVFFSEYPSRKFKSRESLRRIKGVNCVYIYNGDRGGTVVKVLCYKSLVRSPLVPLEFFIDIKSFRSHYGPGVDTASNRNEYQKHFLGGKGGRGIRLTTLPSSCAVVMNSGKLNFLEPSGPLRSSVGIATELRAGRSGIESQWGRDFPSAQTGPGSHPASCTMGTGFFFRGKVRPGRAADHSPPSSAAVMEE